MSASRETKPLLFKGIALFTPGGDIAYCIDTQKQARWHISLCLALQQALGLAEPPHFLVPCYAATVDRWLDIRQQEVQTVAAASPLVLRYAPLLNVIFDTPDLVWQATDLPSGVCDPLVLSAYRSQFPQLWQSHDLILHYKQVLAAEPPIMTQLTSAKAQGYVLRLFVAGNSIATERTLQNLHRLLGECLQQPYTLKVINVAQHPELAEADQISATPTLLRVYPSPMRRVVGSLDNIEQLQGLFSVLDDSQANEAQEREV